jgi:serine/threonine protein kinase
MGAAMQNEDQRTTLEDAVARALELRDAGESTWLEQACAAAPGLAPEVRQAVEDVSRLHGVFSEAAGRDPNHGRVLAERFRIMGRLGSGAMGVVYRARDLTLRRDVAVKVLRGGLVPARELAARFEREAEAMASVAHPTVIAVHDRGVTDAGEPFIVMELVDGESLANLTEELSDVPRDDAPSWLRRNLGLDGRNDPRYVPTVVGWIAELAAGLEAVHRAGVLHRDI